MIALDAHTRVLVAVEPVDFRRGIDGLARVCREELGSHPMSGTVFVFRNRRATAVKLLSYDGQGFWLCHKRLSRGRYRFWPTAVGRRDKVLQAHELQVLLRDGDPNATRAAPVWRALNVSA